MELGIYGVVSCGSSSGDIPWEYHGVAETGDASLVQEYFIGCGGLAFLDCWSCQGLARSSLVETAVSMMI